MNDQNQNNALPEGWKLSHAVDYSINEYPELNQIDTNMFPSMPSHMDASAVEHLAQLLLMKLAEGGEAHRTSHYFMLRVVGALRKEVAAKHE